MYSKMGGVVQQYGFESGLEPSYLYYYPLHDPSHIIKNLELRINYPDKIYKKTIKIIKIVKLWR